MGHQGGVHGVRSIQVRLSVIVVGITQMVLLLTSSAVILLTLVVKQIIRGSSR